MTMMEFFGCTFIAFGPPLAMFIFTIAPDPLRVIVLIASGFFWLLSLLFSSILWFAAKEIMSGANKLRESLIIGLVFSVLFQELFRYLFYKMLRKADEGLQRVSQQGRSGNIRPKDITNKSIMAYVSGLGFGIICGAFSLINVLADMAGPGTVGIHGDSPYFFLASAFLTLSFVFLHTFWGIICFFAWDKKKYIWVAVVILSHMLTSSMTYLNGLSREHISTQYVITIVVAYLTMFITGALAFCLSGGSLKYLPLALRCSKGRHETD
ncbi:gamma-secretase subunit Aph-1 [Octopus bimaculoides]|uniref:Gamma-secretase subunit Aph-1 n=1 Tax=Octopus bimaculoides TaxID=37653 RepID=A0A0L8HNC8_OCTBM|nr:gamma-secretase subunit Aph-1 [Octopus bimaculoides]|eukprot:XP_014770898.1 PREDICTED: gamma-secretase subunit Aph-1-like [Octopus bimaculoides]